LYRGSGNFQFFRRASSSAASTIRSIVCASASITMRSPSATNAIGPPSDRLGSDVAHAESLRPSGEATVGDERGVVAAARALSLHL